MSKIDELLKGEKVEWKKLGEVCNIKRGRVISKIYLEEHKGEFPVYSSQTRNNGEIGSISTYDFDGEFASWTTDGAYAGTVFYRNGKFSVTNICGLIEPKDNKKLLVKFIVYWLQIEAKKHVKGGSGNPKLMSNVVERIKIPIPSIETQEKIVKTLDKFTNYVTELQAELESRTKQYEFYRDMLLSEGYLNNISAKIDRLVSKDYELKFITLGEIGEIQMCKRILKEQTSSQGEVPFYKIGTFGKEADSFISQDLFREYREKYNYPKNGEILLSASGTIGKTVIFDGEDAYFQDSNIVWLSHNERLVLNKYLYYFYQIVKWNPSTGGTINRLYNYNLKNIKIILPPIEIQNKVVEILDEFQSLLADTKGLLPQEIEQRQKQYEYYREKLLTFDVSCAKHTHTHTHTHNLISNSYFELLKEVAEIVGVSVFDVKLKRLEDVAELYDGTHQTPKYVNTGVPFVSVQDIKNIYGTNKYITAEEYNKFKVKPRKNDVFMTRIGDIGTCAIVENDDNLAYYVTLTLIRPSNDIVLSKFLKYLIESSQGKKELSKRILHNATPIKINLGEIGKLQFLIPSIKVQEHIVSILDKFDSIVNNISKGLPKEIELRQKQYEYYREKLLSFKR
ncbi:type I restriction modification DNA specificity domain protein [Parvimonas sp. oral taxon 393 str. F0440]|nr:type I restriction modification DNA specificity domain protein [Parvimonas sp. oral taxon 393 str. F0440]